MCMCACAEMTWFPSFIPPLVIRAKWQHSAHVIPQSEEQECTVYTQRYDVSRPVQRTKYFHIWKCITLLNTTQEAASPTTRLMIYCNLLVTDLLSIQPWQGAETEACKSCDGQCDCHLSGTEALQQHTNKPTHPPTHAHSHTDTHSHPAIADKQ